MAWAQLIRSMTTMPIIEDCLRPPLSPTIFHVRSTLIRETEEDTGCCPPKIREMSKALGSTGKLSQGGPEWAEGKAEMGSNQGESDSDLTEGELFVGCPEYLENTLEYLENGPDHLEKLQMWLNGGCEVLFFPTAKGAFLLTPSYELSIEKASSICEKMNFKSSFSLTKTATGILFKFENPEDYQAVFKKGFHKVTGARFYKKIPIPCRPQKTFTIFVYDVPDDIPEEDLRHALYRFHSVVELTRLPLPSPADPKSTPSKPDSPAPSPLQPPPRLPSALSSVLPSKLDKALAPQSPFEASPAALPPSSLVRITLASLDEANFLLENGLDFYGATFFPTDTLTPTTLTRDDVSRTTRFRRSIDFSRVHELLPVFDAAGFQKIPPPAMKTFKPVGVRESQFGKK